MMAGIKIEFVADVAKFIAGTKNIDRALDDVADALDDTARDGDKATEKLEQSFKELTRAAKKSSEKIGDDMKQHVKKGAKDADEGIKNLKENTASNAKEMGASFTDIESALDAIQGLAAEALEGFGPAGIAAGVAAAAGLGIVISVLQQASEKGNALTESAAELSTALGEEGAAGQAEILRDRFAEVLTSVADVKSMWEVWQARGITSAEIFAEAINAGVVSADNLMAAFNDPNPQRRIELLNGALNDVNASLRSADLIMGRGGSAAASLALAEMTDTELAAANAAVEHRDALDTARESLEKYVAQEEASAAITEAVAASHGLTVAAYLAEQDAASTAAAATTGYAAALDAIADPVATYEAAMARKTAADDAAAVSAQDLIDEWDRQALAAQNFERSLAIIAAAGGEALADELRAQGPAAAAATAALLAQADPQTLDAAVRAHARATGEAVGTALGDGITASGTIAHTRFRQVVDDLAGQAATGVVIPVTVDTTGIFTGLDAARRRVALHGPIIIGTRRV